MLYGIDISHHNKGIDLSKVPYDFVITKGTDGARFCTRTADEHIEAARKRGKLYGVYHFANAESPKNGTMRQQAEYFVRCCGLHSGVAPYSGEGILVLDWEDSYYGGQVVKMGPKKAKEWLDYVYKATGSKPFIYMSKYVTNAFDWSEVAKDYPLWGAQYKDYKPVGYLDMKDIYETKQPWGAWGKPTIRQYTETGRLAGHNGNLDLNVSTMSHVDWLNWAKGVYKQVKSDYDIAQEVINGKWGNGPERMTKLTRAGYSVNKIQNLVNKLLTNKVKYYTIKKGDTLSSISKQFGISQGQIKRWNSLKSDALFEGDKIRVSL